MRPCSLRRAARPTLALLLSAALAALALADGAAGEAARWRWPAVERVVAVGDVHGAHRELLEVLGAAGVVDARGRWSGGTSHLVSLGDLLDRGADSRAVMDLLMRLEGEAAAAGGRVHVVLGNHELMNLTGDVRYVASEEYAAFAGDEPAGVRERERADFVAKRAESGEDAAAAQAAFDQRHPPGFFGQRAGFASNGRYGRWLLERPALVQIGETVFVHGGLPPLVADLGGAALNDRLRRQLPALVKSGEALAAAGLIPRWSNYFDAAEALEKRLAGDEPPTADPETLRRARELVELAGSELLGSEGPLWYRGTALCHPLLELPVLEAALARLDAKRVVVGHTLTADRRIGARLGGRVLMTDVGMLASRYQGRPAALVIEADAVRAIVPGEPAPEVPRARAWHELAAGLGAERLETLLAEAPLEAAGEPRVVGQPMRVDANGVSVPVLFRDQYPVGLLPADGGGDVRADRRRTNEIAAYRLDRLLGLDLVPVTVERRLKKSRGVLQGWPAETLSEVERREQDRSVGSWCAEGSISDLVASFDALAHNRARTVYSIHYERVGSDWRMWLTSNAFAFGREEELPPHLAAGSFRVPPLLAQRLARLDETTLRETLKGVLGPKEIRALLARRDALLAARSR